MIGAVLGSNPLNEMVVQWSNGLRRIFLQSDARCQGLETTKFQIFINKIKRSYLLRPIFFTYFTGLGFTHITETVLHDLWSKLVRSKLMNFPFMITFWMKASLRQSSLASHSSLRVSFMIPFQLSPWMFKKVFLLHNNSCESSDSNIIIIIIVKSDTNDNYINKVD